jgi:hypothetical protein
VHRSWSPPSPLPGAATSDTPAVAPLPSFVGDPEQSLMTWKGPPGDQHLYQSISAGGPWSAPAAVDGVATSSQPALAATVDGSLWRAWKGLDGDPGIWWASGDPAGGWSPQAVIPGVGTSHGPALVLF